MDLRLYHNFSKKENSTARPLESPMNYDVYSVTWKTPSSILSPVFEISRDVNFDYKPTYNYAYCLKTARCYWVTDISYNRGVWEIYCRVDPLATYKLDIGATTMYIERCASEKNGSLIDKMYPLTDNYSVSRTTIKSASTFASGCIVLNVINGASNSGTTSYVMSISSFGNFLDNIMVGCDEDVHTLDSLLQTLKVTKYEPLKYIAGAYWFPTTLSSIASGSAFSTMKLGNFTASGFTAYKVSESLSDLTKTYTATLPKHSQAGTRGSFCNLEPYSEYTVNLGPFGCVKLDTAALADATSITIKVLQDVITGQGRALITTDTNAMVANVVAQWGVPLRVSATGQGSLQAILQYATGTAAVIGAAATGGASLAIGAAGAASMISGLDGMGKGVVSSTGSSGAVIDHLPVWDLESKFYTIANDDNTNNGRPLCASRQIANLSGYIKCQKGLVVSTTATKTELDAINAYMEAGFYYE